MIGMDIRTQIQLHKNRLETYNIEKNYLVKQMLISGCPVGYKPIDYSGMPHGSKDATSLDRVLEAIGKLESHIYLEEETIKLLEKQEISIKENIEKLKGIDAQVKYLRDMEGMRLQEIADRLGYELGYIKNVSCRNPK